MHTVSSLKLNSCPSHYSLTAIKNVNAVLGRQTLMGSLAMLARHGDSTNVPLWNLSICSLDIWQASNVMLGDSHETATLHDVMGTFCTASQPGGHLSVN